LQTKLSSLGMLLSGHIDPVRHKGNHMYHLPQHSLSHTFDHNVYLFIYVF